VEDTSESTSVESEQTPQRAAPVAGPDPQESRYQAVREAIAAQQNPQRSWLKNVGILLVSLILFFQLGLLKWGLNAVGAILLVIVVHEAGHWLAMKAFGYRNVQMFFIPLIGAAVAGRGHRVAAWKEAVVSLCGPLPGILVGCVLMILHMFVQNPVLLRLGAVFLALNLLNLLPIRPLDGGRFVHQVLFSRNRYVEMVANILMAGVLLLIGGALGSWLFGFLGFLQIMSVRQSFRMATVAEHLKKEWSGSRSGGEEAPPQDSAQGEDIPENLLRPIVDWITHNMPGPMKPKAMADVALQLWNRIAVRPPGIGATVLLLWVAAMGYVLPLGAFVTVGVWRALNDPVTKQIVEEKTDDGTVLYKQQVRFWDTLQSEIELSDDQRLYSGRHVRYYPDGTLYEQGQWADGLRTGPWALHDPNGVMTAQVWYEAGHPVRWRYREGDEWAEHHWEDLSAGWMKYYEWHRQHPKGPAAGKASGLLHPPSDPNTALEDMRRLLSDSLTTHK